MKKLDCILELCTVEELRECIDNYEVLIEFNEKRGMKDKVLQDEYHKVVSRLNELSSSTLA